MTKSVYVDATRTRVVPEGSPAAAFRLHVRDAERLGILTPKPDGEKQAKRPADKMARRGPNK